METRRLVPLCLLILGLGPGQTEAGWEWINPLPPEADLESIIGFGPDQMFVDPDYPNPNLLSWDGESWGELENRTLSSIVSFWGTGPDDLYAVGTEIIHWDGEHWSILLESSSIGSIWGTSPEDLWISAPGDGRGDRRVRPAGDEDLFRRLRPVAEALAGWMAPLLHPPGHQDQRLAQQGRSGEVEPGQPVVGKPLVPPGDRELGTVDPPHQ